MLVLPRSWVQAWQKLAFPPYYAGAAIGASQNNGNEAQFCDQCAGSQFTMHKKNTGGAKVHKVYAGANLNPVFGVEAEYVNLGDTYAIDMYRPEFGIPGGRAETARAHQKTRGIGISAKANRRITRKTSVYGKVGAFAWENKNSMDYTNLDGINERYKSTDRGISPTVGLGVEHEVTDRISIRVGWDRTFDTGSSDRFLELDANKNVVDLHSVKTDTDMIYVGATFNF